VTYRIGEGGLRALSDRVGASAYGSSRYATDGPQISTLRTQADVTREQVVEGLRRLLALPVEHLLETHGGIRPERARARVRFAAQGDYAERS
jgi:hypothetical protein